MKQKLIQYLPARLFVFLKGYGWYGNYATWGDAKKSSIGYNAANIVEHVKKSLIKVKNGEAIYERDSVLFDHIEYAWELLASIMWIAAQNNGRLNLIDFGGSLGSTYYQNKRFLDELSYVSWNIVEQPDYVNEGIQSFQNETLKFYPTITACCLNASDKVNVILFSSVLQYLEYPYDFIDEAIRQHLDYIIVDRTGFTLNDRERITVQKVPSRIYSATYPCRFFGESQFVLFFNQRGYELISDFKALDQANVVSEYKGYIFKRKKSC